MFKRVLIGLLLSSLITFGGTVMFTRTNSSTSSDSVSMKIIESSNIDDFEKSLNKFLKDNRVMSVVHETSFNDKGSIKYFIAYVYYC